jgi:hypothetical protein
MTREQDIIKQFIGGDVVLPRSRQVPEPRADRHGFRLCAVDAILRAEDELEANPPSSEPAAEPVARVTERDKDRLRAEFGLPTKSQIRKRAECAFQKTNSRLPPRKPGIAR